MEEEYFHKEKIIGPMYKLNQKILNMFAIENSLKIEESFTTEICNTKNKAFNLLRHIITGNKNIFILPKNQNEWDFIKFANQVDQVISKNYEIFLTYISYIQMEIKNPYCLSKIIPGFNQYMVREKYLKNIDSQYSNKESLGVISKIFIEVEHLDSLKKKCAKI